MPSTPESKVKNKVKKVLNAHKVYYAMPHGAGYGNAGVPDFLVCLKGEFIGIECKANGNKPTALQMWNLVEIHRSGGRGFIVDETNVDRLLEDLTSC